MEVTVCDLHFNLSITPIQKQSTKNDKQKTNKRTNL